MNRIKSLILATAVFASVSAMAQTAEEIVNNNLNALGGKEKLSSLKTIVMEGTMTTNGVDVGLTLTRKHMEGQRLDLEIMGTSNYRVLNTKKGSIFMPIMQQTDPRAMTDAEFKSESKQLDAQGSFLDYKDKGYKIDLEGQENINGKKAYKLKVDKGGDVSTYFVDAATWYIVKIISKVDAQGQSMEVENTYADFKKNADGFIFPYSMTNAQGKITWDKISTNVPVDNKIFEN